VGAAGRFQRFRHAADGKIVALGASARENDLGGITANQRGDRDASLIYYGLRPLPEMVDAGGIAEFVAQGVGHPIGDVRGDGRRGVVIEVNALHGVFSA
jgi:hypothetical protein